MKNLIFCWVLLSVVGLAHGQDPTVPSQAILDRLPSNTAVAARVESRPLPVVQLRALVMRNTDRGTAMIEVDGQLRFLRLDRAMLPATRPGSETKLESNGLASSVQLSGAVYTVEDFTERTIVLSDGLHRILVH